VKKALSILALLLERLAANASFATALGSNPASSGTVESEAADEAVLNTIHEIHKNPKNPPI